MRVMLALVLLLVAVPAARADEVKKGEGEKEVTATVVRTAEAEPAAPDLVLEEVKVPEARRAESATPATTQEMPRRGSFWWLVGVIVVAGIILAVVLD